MSLTRLVIVVVFCAFGIGLFTIAGAQDGEEAERSRFIRYVEEQLSTPDQQIRLGQIDGALSSDVEISSITVSDREGIWLTLEGVHLVWNRLALLGGKLDVDLLEAKRILLPRTAQRGESAERPEFEVPELPIEVEINSLRVPRVEIGEPVFGQESVLSVDGNMTLGGGSLDTSLTIGRVDAGGQLVIDAQYSNESRQLDLNFDLTEPADGVIANLLKLHGRPAVKFVVAGSGPLDAFKADVSLAADDELLLDGAATISKVESGLRFVTELNGRLDRIVSPTFADFVDTGSRLKIDVTRHDDGAFSIHAAELTSGVVSLNASAEIASDGFPTRLALDARLGAEGGQPVPLPGGGGNATVESAHITASLGSNADDTWSAEFDLRGLRAAALSSTRTSIHASGMATNLTDPKNRALTFDLDGTLAGLGSGDPDIAAALGTDIEIAAAGQWMSGRPVEVREARANNSNIRARFEGDVDGDMTTGTYSLSADSLALFAGIAESSLAGAVDLLATGTARLSGREFDLRLDGKTRNLDVGVSALAKALVGTTTLSGRVKRSGEGFGFRQFEARNDHLAVVVDGDYLSDRSDLRLDGRIGDLTVVTERAGGAAVVHAEASGPAEGRSLLATLKGENLSLGGRPFHDAVARFEGSLGGGDIVGGVSLTGRLEEVPVDASARLSSFGDGTHSIADLDIRAGRTTASGGLTLSLNGLAKGDIRIDSPDISAIAPLLLADASGALVADISLLVEDGGQSANISASALDLQYQTFRLGSASIDVKGQNLLAVPILDGRLEARAVAIGEFMLDELLVTATRDGDTTRFAARADLADGILTTTGELRPAEGGFDLAIRNLDLEQGAIDVRLAAPANVSIRGKTVAISGASLGVGGGRVDVMGEIGEQIDLKAEVTDLPMAVMNAFAPYLKGRGTLSGSVRAGGTLNDPVADFAVTGNGISARPLTRLGVDTLNFTGRGRLADDTLSIEANADVAGGKVAVSGTIGKTLDLTANISDLPLSIANAMAPELGLGGTASGVIVATGSLEAPNARFEIEGRRVVAESLREVGLDALSVDARGRLVGDVIKLDEAKATGNGLIVEAKGDVPLSGTGLDLALHGTLPLALTDRLLIDLGTRLRGTVRADMQVKGSLSDPRLTGTISATEAIATGPEAGLQLRNITLRSSLDGDTMVIHELSGRLGDGTVTAIGSIGIRPEAGYPADLRITMRNARYTDGDLVTATFSGSMTLTGALADGAVLGGTIDVDRTEITVPESLPKSARMLDVKHRNAPPDVIATLIRAGLGPDNRRSRGASNSALTLNLRIVAPARVFVRGRGLDAELGGEVTLTGAISNVRAVGAFRMRRGRLDILGQRIALDRGDLTLLGDLDPVLDFLATTRGDTISVTLTVTGRASNPEIGFSSVPDLPDDEVFAQLLFGRGISELSPLQIAQLAAAAAELAGGGGGGILEQIRATTGLDNLDVVSDSEGRVGVEVGRYISDNIYLGVRGSEESSGVSINLDITDELTARAEAGQDDSKIGVFYEFDY